MSTGHILLLGLIAGLTIFIGLPMGRLHDVGQPILHGAPDLYGSRRSSRGIEFEVPTFDAHR